MNFNVTINNILTIDEIPNYWKTDDYVKLLDRFGFPDAKSRDIQELQELLFMAISDYEPNEAAAIVLDYKLSEHLSEGQIDQLSNEMLLDKVCEEYPVIALHRELFSVNQLVYKAYNGKFPNAKASLISCTVTPVDNTDNLKITKEYLMKILYKSFSSKNIAKRLYEEQLTTALDFPEAEAILWEMNSTDNQNIEFITSEYWLQRDDFDASEFVGELQIEA
jgi:hypothetical protein